MSSSTSTHTFRTNVPPLSPTITHFAISYLHCGSIFLQALHPLFDVVCYCGGPVCLCCFLGALWLPSLSSHFHEGIYNGLMTFLYSAHHCFYLSLSPGPINWAVQAESNISCITKGSPSLRNCHLKNKITSPGARTTASVIHSSRPSLNMLGINTMVHAWEGGAGHLFFPLKLL